MTNSYTAQLIQQKEATRQRIEADKRQILTNPELFQHITLHEFDKRIVGEIPSRQTLFLCAAGGLWVANATPAAYNLMVNSSSGAGKDYVTEQVLAILPQERVEKRTRITPTVFTYWHNSKYEPAWTWDGKVCFLSDVSNSVLNSDVLKVMVTEGSHTTVVKDQRAVDIEVKGKPALIITTARATPNYELLRRFPILELDETLNQTAAIMWREAEYAEEGKSVHYNGKVRSALAELQRVKVRVPFATKLVPAFPPDHLIMRTHFNRAIDYIKASAALHQWQRARDEDYIVAEPQDYEIARIALMATTSNPSMIPLTKTDKELLDIAKKWGKSFAVKDIEHLVTFMSQRSLYVHLAKLAEHGLLDVTSERRESVFKPVTVYALKKFSVHIPTWDEICNISANTSVATITSINTNTSNTAQRCLGTEKQEIKNIHADSLDGVFEENEVFVSANNSSDTAKNANTNDVTKMMELCPHGNYPDEGCIFCEKE